MKWKCLRWQLWLLRRDNNRISAEIRKHNDELRIANDIKREEKENLLLRETIKKIKDGERKIEEGPKCACKPPAEDMCDLCKQKEQINFGNAAVKILATDRCVVVNCQHRAIDGMLYCAYHDMLDADECNDIQRELDYEDR